MKAVMKEFPAGRIFLCAAALLSLVGFLLFPLIMAAAFLLRFILILAFAALAIWLPRKPVLTPYEKIT